MPETYLHGVEVVEIGTGLRPIRTARSGVIGIVGTAPDAGLSALATLTTGVSSSDNQITWTANIAGAAGNNVTIRLANPGVANAALSVTVSGVAVTINLATGSTGAITSTAAEVVSAVRNSAATSLVVTAKLASGTGAGVVRAVGAALYLSGGEDEPFPLNTPVLISGSRAAAAALDTTGNRAGTLPAALDGILDQIGAAVVVVRVRQNIGTSRLELAAGLAESQAIEPGAAFSHNIFNPDYRLKSITMAASLEGLDGSAGGEIFEAGSENIGAYVGFRANGDFIVRCGFGGAGGADETHVRTAYLLVDSASAPSGSGVLVWSFELDAATTEWSVRAWWEPVGGYPVELVGASQSTTNGDGSWSGSSAGSFWNYTSPALLGEVSDKQPVGTPTAPLRMYFDQEVGTVTTAMIDALPDSDTRTISNVVGGTNGSTGQYLGVHALLGAEAATGVAPRILCAPGFTHQRPDGAANPVVSELLGIADRLRAVIIADGPNSTDAAAATYRDDWGSSRVYMVDPWVQVYVDGQVIDEPASARVAGVIARVDNDEGFWVSPSNKPIYGIVGTSRPIDFKLGDQNSRANLLNEQGIATIIRSDGFRLWGNRSLTIDEKWVFLSVRRTADMLNETLQQQHMWAVDRNITKTYIEDVAEGVNAYIARLVSQQALIGGRCWADPDLNTPANIAAGNVFFNFEFTAPYPAEHITFRSILTTDYLEELV